LQEHGRNDLCSLMEAVKTCDGFGTFYRPGGEEEKGLVEIKMAGGEVVLKSSVMGGESTGRRLQERKMKIRWAGPSWSGQ
jgi:hypothetical protein